MYCNNCGKEVANNDVVCLYCGKAISKDRKISVFSLDEPQNKIEKTYLLLAKISLLLMLVAFHSLIALTGFLIGIASLIMVIVSKVKYNYRFFGLTLAISISGIISNLMIFIFFVFII